MTDQTPCTSEDPNHPGLTCNFVADHDGSHYAMGYQWDDKQNAADLSDQVAGSSVRADRGAPMRPAAAPVAANGNVDTSGMVSLQVWCNKCGGAAHRVTGTDHGEPWESWHHDSPADDVFCGLVMDAADRIAQ